jgi:predicted transcriptional regulator
MWIEYGYVVASKYRKHILLSLLKHPKTPTQLAAEMHTPLGHISRSLQELSRKNIVVCINPDAIKGKIYQLTEMGIIISNQICEDAKV